MTSLKRNFFMFALLALTVLMPDFAHATSAFSVGDKVCRVYNCIVDNNLLIVIATVAIFFLGIGAFFGKVNWGLVIVIVLGIVVIVGAGEIAQMLADENSTCFSGTVSC